MSVMRGQAADPSPDITFFDQHECATTMVRAYEDAGMITIEMEMPHYLSRSVKEEGSAPFVMASGAISRKQASVLIGQIRKALGHKVSDPVT